MQTCDWWKYKWVLLSSPSNLKKKLKYEFIELHIDTKPNKKNYKSLIYDAWFLNICQKINIFAFERKYMKKNSIVISKFWYK